MEFEWLRRVTRSLQKPDFDEVVSRETVDEGDKTGQGTD
jgi:hypothetical protein